MDNDQTDVSSSDSDTGLECTPKPRLLQSVITPVFSPKVDDIPLEYGTRSKYEDFRAFSTMSKALGKGFKEVSCEWGNAKLSGNVGDLYADTYAKYSDQSNKARVTGICPPSRSKTSGDGDLEADDDSDHSADEDNTSAVDIALLSLGFTRVDIDTIIENLTKIQTRFNAVVTSFRNVCRRFVNMFEDIELWRGSRSRKRGSNLADHIMAMRNEMEEFGLSIQHQEITTDVVFSARRCSVAIKIEQARKSLEKQLYNIRLESTHKAAGTTDVTHVAISDACQLGSWNACREGIENDAESLSKGPIDAADILEMATLLEFEGSTTLAQLTAKYTGRNLSGDYAELIHVLVMKYLPVAVFTTMNCYGNTLIIDLSQSMGDPVSISTRLVDFNSERLKEGKLKTKGGKRRQSDNPGGRIPLHITIGELVDAVTEVVKQHSPRPDLRRRHQIIESGVSLKTLKKEVIKQIPELKSIDCRTIARLMMPPKANTLSAKLYKRLIEAKITRAENDLRIVDSDAHYTCAQASILREMMAWLGSECRVFSADEKCNLVIGEAGLVSRYHQNANVTPDKLVVSKFDHDFKYSKFLVSVSGFMELDNPPVHQEYTCPFTARQRVRTASSGSSNLTLRGVLFDRPDLHSHVTDFEALLHKMRGEGRGVTPVIGLIVDGGVSYLTTREATVLLFGRLFRDFELEGLIILRRSRGLSAYNEIERLWAFISKRLAGKICSACADGDTTPPCQQPSLSDTEREKKEVYIFDTAMNEVSKILNDDLKFGDYPISVRPILSRNAMKYRATRDSDYNQICSFNGSSVKGETKKLFDEWKDIIRHVDFRMHVIAFSPCDDRQCVWPQCRKITPDLAPRWSRIRTLFAGSAPSPLPSNTHPQHFHTFLEMLDLAGEGYKFPPNDYHCPSVACLDDESAMFCNSLEYRCSKHWTYTSNTARHRHDVTIHADEKKVRQRASGTYTVSCQTCRCVFNTIIELNKHYASSSCTGSSKQVYRYWKRKPSMIAAKTVTGPLPVHKRMKSLVKQTVESLTTATSQPEEGHVHQQPSDPANDSDDRQPPCRKRKPSPTEGLGLKLQLTRRKTESQSEAVDYSGNVKNFNVPPDEKLVPDTLTIGVWVFSVFTGYKGRADRGIIVNRRKRSSVYIVRFIDSDGVTPADYELDVSTLFLTRREAEEHFLKLAVFGYDTGGSDDSEQCGEDEQEHDTDRHDSVDRANKQGGKGGNVQNLAGVSRPILYLIITMLGASDSVSMMLTCRHMHTYCSSNAVWARFYTSHPVTGLSILDRLQNKFTLLTDDQSLMVLRAMKGDVPTPHGLPDYFDLNSLNRLADRKWLNDEVIDQYMHLLDSRNPTFYRVLGSTVWRKLSRDGFEGLKKWHVVQSIDLNTLRAVTFPCNILNNHWRLCVVNVDQKRLEIWDSMSSTAIDQIDRENFAAMRAFVEGIAEAEGITSNWSELKMSVPQQTNCDDCGIFVCKNADFLSDGWSLKVKQVHITYFRKRMMLELVKCCVD